jgi:PAS domain-containing protein
MKPALQGKTGAEMADRGTSERHRITAEMELRLLAEYCTDVIARVGADMTFSYISPSAERMFRRPVSEVIRHPVRAFAFPEDLPILAAATARLIAGEVDSSTVTVRALRVAAWKQGPPRQVAELWEETRHREAAAEGASTAPPVRDKP